MSETPGLGKPKRPRWDSYPLPGKFDPPTSPRWNAGVRCWPGAVLLGSVVPLFVGFTIAFGFTNGPFITAAVVASYPALLVVAPARQRLVPREVGASSSPVPLRVWVVGWLLVAGGIAYYPLPLNGTFVPDNSVLWLLVSVPQFVLVYGGVFLIAKAPAWELWRNRPRKRGRISPHDGDGSANGPATSVQSH
jgi:hypothetical protein